MTHVYLLLVFLFFSAVCVESIMSSPNQDLQPTRIDLSPQLRTSKTKPKPKPRTRTKTDPDPSTRTSKSKSNPRTRTKTRPEPLTRSSTKSKSKSKTKPSRTKNSSTYKGKSKINPIVGSSTLPTLFPTLYPTAYPTSYETSTMSPTVSSVCTIATSFSCGGGITFCNDNCLCTSTTEGNPYCVHDATCSSLNQCTSSSDCAAGTACVVNTCCTGLVCASECSTVDIRPASVNVLEYGECSLTDCA